MCSTRGSILAVGLYKYGWTASPSMVTAQRKENNQLEATHKLKAISLVMVFVFKKKTLKNYIAFYIEEVKQNFYSTKIPK